MRLAGTGTPPVAEALIAMDRENPDPLAGIGEPSVAAESFEVIHSVRVTEKHTTGLREGGESNQPPMTSIQFQPPHLSDAQTDTSTLVSGHMAGGGED